MSESQTYSPVMYGAFAAKAADAGTPIEPGTAEITASVRVVFGIG